MKQLNKKRLRTAANAWGRDSTVSVQHFEVEESDVGTTLEHWGGYNYKTLKIAKRDVGKVIEVMSSPGWKCLGFCNSTPHKD